MPRHKGGAEIKWDKYPEMRNGFRILHEGLDMSGRNRVKVMNVAFEKQLKDCGYSDGVPEDKYDTLESQWRERKKGNNAQKWEFSDQDKKVMTAKLRKIAVPMGLVKKDEGEADGTEVDDTQELPEAAGDEEEGDDAEEESEVDDGGREDSDGDDEFIGGRQTKRIKRATSSNALTTRQPTTRKIRPANGRAETTTTRSTTNGSKRSTAAAKGKSKVSTKKQAKPPREPKLPQSAMPLEKKFKKVHNSEPEPGFHPFEKTSDHFGKKPVASPWILDSNGEAPQNQEEVDAIAGEDSDEGEQNIPDAPQQQDPIVINSDASESDSDSDDDSEPPDLVQQTILRPRRGNAQSTIRQPKMKSRAIDTEKDGKRKANEAQKTTSQNIDEEGDGESSSSLSEPEDEGTPPPPKKTRRDASKKPADGKKSARGTSESP